MKLIIPSAKVVPEELQSLGKLPAIIYPVGDKIVFDYLLEHYEKEVDFIDVLYYEMPEETACRLNAYLSDKVRLRCLTKLRDLGNTVYEGLEEQSSSVIINFADTIVFDRIQDAEEDCFYYAEEYASERWTFFEEEQGEITAVFDKSSNLDTKILRKVFVGVFKISDQSEFKRCLEKAFHEESRRMDSFYYALMLYSKIHPVKAVPTDNWFDIGHADKYYNSKLEVKAREFNHIIIDRDRGILKKFSDDKEKFVGEILWYLKLPADIEYVRPRIFSYSTSYGNPYVEMEYYSYHTLHELFLFGDLSYQQWLDIFKRIRFIYNDFGRYQVRGQEIRTSLEDVYLKKTLQRLEQLKNDERFQTFFNKEMVINGVKYLPLKEICRCLEKLIPEMLYDVEAFHIIHGDLCFANIMIDSNFSFIKVIDPRGRFGIYDIYGDQRYELAKLFHSVDGKYDFIIKDLFQLKAEPDRAVMEFLITERQRDYNLYEACLRVFKEEIGADLKKIELIEALLFLSMIPLHGESLEHQYVMLGTGVQILDRMADIRI